jgi:iron complex transport system substrate-binding protein
VNGRARAALFAAALMAACAPARAQPAAPAKPVRIVSLDYCADQFVLKLAPRERIAAVSPDAGEAYSAMRSAAAGVARVRPRIEDVLALKPDLVVRSYGGGPGVAAALERAGVPVAQIGYEDTLAGARRNVLAVARALGEEARGATIVADMDARLAALRSGAGDRPRALYYTSGGVTTGPGGLVDEMMRAAGLANFETEPGWRSLPLERLAVERPDIVVVATFGAADGGDFWSAARHPIARDVLAARPVAEIEGAWTSCAAWMVVDGVEAMQRAAAR